MTRLSILAVCLISAFAINFVECSVLPSTPGFKVSVVENIEDFLKENPEVQEVPLVKGEEIFDGVSPQFQRAYSFGRRIAGDHQLATDQENQQWATPQNYKKNLFYPNGGIGSVVTYLEVIVDQSTNLGRAFITRGGIGQRSIEIVMEAENTVYFSYRASIYGY